MTFLDSLERRFGRFAIPGLVRIVVGFNALVFVLHKLNPAYLSALDLAPDKVLQGEVWRLITYIFIPQFGAGLIPDWLSVLLYLFFLWFVGTGLEEAWGAFRLNMFYLVGMIGTTAAAYFFGQGFSNSMLNMSLYFAFAWFYPEMMILAFFIIPVKIKWLAWFMAGTIFLGFLLGGLSYRMAVLAAFANYLLFFGPEIYREARHRRGVASRRRRFEKQAAPEGDALHTCEVCKRTELSDPHLEFRVSRDGHEYCLEHLPKRPAGTPVGG